MTLGTDIADLTVTKTNGTMSVVPGTQTTYTIVVSNDGPSDVAGVDRHRQPAGDADRGDVDVHARARERLQPAGRRPAASRRP